MNIKISNLRGNEPEFAEFWRSFQLSRWKWVHELASRSRYLVSVVLMMYAVLAYLTFFPDNKWIAPLHISNPDLITYLGGDQILVLKHYGSINIIFLGMIMLIVLLIRWHRQIPALFQWLWESGRLESKGGHLKIEFEQCLQDYQKALLSIKEPLIIGFSLPFIFIVIGLWAGIPGFLMSFFTPPVVALLTFLVLIGFLCLYMVGQAGWIGFVTGRQIGRLSRQFDIKIQLRHPDRCGGLKPLGGFCVEAALPFIGVGLILATVPILHLDIDDVLSIMATVVIFVFFGPLAVLAVFAPLWQIHLEMARQKMIYEDGFASQAMALEQIIRDHTTEKGDLKKAENAKAKIEILQSVNPEKASYPVWPFHLAPTVLAVFSPQIIDIAIKIYQTFSS